MPQAQVTAAQGGAFFGDEFHGLVGPGVEPDDVARLQGQQVGQRQGGAAGLQLERQAALGQGCSARDQRWAGVAGQPAASELYRRVTAKASPMPPEGSGRHLSVAQIAHVLGKSHAATNSLLQRARATALARGGAYFFSEDSDL